MTQLSTDHVVSEWGLTSILHPCLYLMMTLDTSYEYSIINHSLSFIFSLLFLFLLSLKSQITSLPPSLSFSLFLYPLFSSNRASPLSQRVASGPLIQCTGKAFLQPWSSTPTIPITSISLLPTFQGTLYAMVDIHIHIHIPILYTQCQCAPHDQTQ